MSLIILIKKLLECVGLNITTISTKSMKSIYKIIPQIPTGVIIKVIKCK